MRMINLKNASPYAGATLNVAPWYLSVCGDQYNERELTKEQILVRDVVETAAGIGTRAAMFDYLKSQRSLPMRDMAVKDPRLNRFVKGELDPEKLCRLSWDMFAHYAVSLPYRYVTTLMCEDMKSEGCSDRLVNRTLAAMSIFSLKTVFKSLAVRGLYSCQAFGPELCTAFECGTPVPMSSALGAQANVYIRKPNYEFFAAAMMAVSGSGYLDAARRAKDDPMMQQSLARQALRSFGLATVFSLSVRENAHCFSPVILDTLQRYSGYMQGSIALWQSRV